MDDHSLEIKIDDKCKNKDIVNLMNILLKNTF